MLSGEAQGGQRSLLARVRAWREKGWTKAVGNRDAFCARQAGEAGDRSVSLDKGEVLWCVSKVAGWLGK